MAADVIHDAEDGLTTITDLNRDAMPITRGVLPPWNPEIHVNQAVTTNTETAVLSFVRAERRRELAVPRDVLRKPLLELSDLLDGRHPFEVGTRRDIARTLLENTSLHASGRMTPKLVATPGVSS